MKLTRYAARSALRKRALQAHSRGQALVEFALVLPIAVLLLIGIIQLGLMLSAYVGATNVAREVARFGSVCLVRDTPTAASCRTQIRDYLDDVLPQRINAGDPAPDKTEICYTAYLAPKADPVNDPDRWNVRLQVSLGIRYPLFMPIIGNLMDGIDGEPGDGLFLLIAEEAMRVEGGGIPTEPVGLGCG